MLEQKVSFARATLKIQNLMEPMTSITLRKALFAHATDTSGDHCVFNLLVSDESPISTSKDKKGMRLGAKTRINVPNIPLPAPNHIKNLIHQSTHGKDG